LDLEVIDLRTLVPWDQATVFDSVKKTSKALVLYEATQTAAFGAEIAASIAESCFEWLDAPVRRLGSLDTPVPFHPELEQGFMAQARLAEVVEDLMAY
ncbi:MAG: transketolase C-terminal domain-containing protein, partial [Bacteroidota bacterium]